MLPRNYLCSRSEDLGSTLRSTLEVAEKGEP
jgi:hypothetical protein